MHNIEMLKWQNLHLKFLFRNKKNRYMLIQLMQVFALFFLQHLKILLAGYYLFHLLQYQILAT